jgi:O-methyltransferase
MIQHQQKANSKRSIPLVNLKVKMSNLIPEKWRNFIRIFLNWRDRQCVVNFLCNSNLTISLREKLRIVKQIYSISYNIDCPHNQAEMILFIQAILSLPGDKKGCIVEAGCYKGGSTAKFSLAARIIDRELVVFDSFEGLPEHNEAHIKNIFNRPVTFVKGEYCGNLDEVKANVSKYGRVEVCRFIKGWFEETLPHFNESISALYLDVDLASSVQVCLKYLYPLLEPGGVLYSHDGHLPLVIEILNDDEFWENEVGCKKPHIEGLWKKKLITIVKEKETQTTPSNP